MIRFLFHKVEPIRKINETFHKSAQTFHDACLMAPRAGFLNLGGEETAEKGGSFNRKPCRMVLANGATAKDELHLRRCSTFGEIVTEIADYIDYYNNWRPQAGLGKMTPAEFREYLLAKPVGLPVPLAGARENGKCGAALPVSQ